MAQITQEFNEPFSQKANSLSPLYSSSVIGLAGRPYLMDTEGGQFRRQSVDVVQQRNTTDPRDVLLLPQDVWRQQAQSWHYGAGQSNMDRETSLPYRYQDSFGIDPWEPWRLTLLNKTQRMTDPGYTKWNIWLSIQGDYLCIYNGQKIFWKTDPSSATLAGTTIVSPGNDILDIANDGLVPTVLTADRYIWHVNSPTSAAVKWANHQYSANVTFVEWEKDYLLVGDGNVLYNAVKSNNPTAIYTHPDTNFRWYDAAAGSQFIYTIGYVGDRTTIHKIGIKADGTGLVPAIVAATLPDGEVGDTIDSYLGYIFIGTNKGVRMAQADGNGDLVLGAIIPTEGAVRCFEGQDRFVWYGNQKINCSYTASTSPPVGGQAGVGPAVNSGDVPTDYFPPYAYVSGLGRMDLTTFTTTALTPAYANDICVLDASYDPGFYPQSVVTFNGMRVFSVYGQGVFYEITEKMEAGWLTQGTMSYSVEDIKTALYTQTKWEPLSGNIYLDLSYDSNPFSRIANYTTQGSIRSDNTNLNGYQFSRVNARYVLHNVSGTQSPVLTRWEVRVVPVRGLASRWVLPIMNYDTVEIDGVIYNRDVTAEFDTLLSLVQNGELFILQESGRSYQVTAKEFQWMPEKISANGKGWQGMFFLTVQEIS